MSHIAIFLLGAFVGAMVVCAILAYTGYGEKEEAMTDKEISKYLLDC